MAQIQATGNKNHHSFTLTVSEDGYSVDNNESSISFVLTASASSYDIAWTSRQIVYTVTINGKPYSVSTGIYPKNASWTVITGSGIPIPHEDDGSKVLTFSFSVTDNVNQWYSTGNAYANGTMVLTTIPRNAKITNCPSSLTDIESPWFSFSNPINRSMSCWLEVNPVGEHRAARTVPTATAGTFTWELTDTERSQLIEDTNALASATIRMGLLTEGFEKASYVDIPFYIKESEDTKPALNNVSFTLIETKNFNCYVKGMSKVKAIFSANGKYGASIVSYSLTVGNRTYSNKSAEITSDIIESIGTVTVVGTVTDSRGFTASAQQEIFVYNYLRPYVAPYGNYADILCERCNSDGVFDESGKYVYIAVKKCWSKIDGGNKCTLSYCINDSTNKTTILDADSETDSYKGILKDSSGENVSFEINKEYDINFAVTDTIGQSRTITCRIPTDHITLHLAEGGRGVGVFTYSHPNEYNDYDREFRIDGNLKYKPIFYNENAEPIDKEFGTIKDFLVDFYKSVAGVSYTGNSGVPVYSEAQLEIKKWYGGSFEISGIADCSETPVYMGVETGIPIFSNSEGGALCEYSASYEFDISDLELSESDSVFANVDNFGALSAASCNPYISNGYLYVEIKGISESNVNINLSPKVSILIKGRR